MNAWPTVLPVAMGAAGIAAWAAAHPTSQLFGPTLCRTPRASTVALTFDDGPNPAVTPKLLALLEKYDAKATFFLVGRFARACPDLVNEIAVRGHSIGNHTETHPNLTFLSAARIREEMQQCQDSISGAATRVVPIWMRPPYGFRGPQLWRAVQQAGLKGVVLWSLTGYDWKPQPPERLIARLSRIQKRFCKAVATPKAAESSGEIVLLHDGDFRELGGDRRHVITALEHWLPRWRDNGIKMASVDQIMGTSQGQ